MQRTLLVFLLLLGACARQSEPQAHAIIGTSRSLRLALLQHAYWSGGFERPLFLVLSDGTVLAPRTLERGIPTTYSHLALSPAGIDSLLATLGVDSTLYLLDSLYDYAPGVTDQHSFYLLLPQDADFTIRTFRAAWRDSADLRTDVPEPFRRFYRRLKALDLSSARDWTPDSVQVQIWPYEYAPDNPPLAWPADLPPLTDRRWRRRSDELVEEVRTLNLPFREVPQLDSLVRGLRPRQALGIGGRKWAFGYRWLFPAEAEWWPVAQRLEY